MASCPGRFRSHVAGASAPLPRSSPTWGQCSALERIGTRFNDGFRFKRHTVRGKDRMAAKMGLALGSVRLTRM